MKLSRILVFLVTAAALAHGDAAAKLQVVSTLEDFASLAQTIGGDQVETFALARGYQDPHYVDAKPSFILKLSKADLLIVAGLELEIGYLPPLTDQSRNARIHPGGPGYLDASVGAQGASGPSASVVLGPKSALAHPCGQPVRRHTTCLRATAAPPSWALST